MHLSRLLAAFISLIAIVTARAQDAPALPAFPTYFVIAPQAQLKPTYTTFEIYGETEFSIPHADKIIQRGKHWDGVLTVPGVPDSVDAEDTWVHQLKPPLVDAGWTFFAEERGQPKIARYRKDAHDTWLTVGVEGNDDIRFDIVEVGPCPIKMEIPRPAGKPETVSPDSGDFPFLPPIPGSTPGGSHHDDGPMIISAVPVDKDHSEDIVAGTGSITKNYKAPPFQSPVLFVTVYANALTLAGWKIIRTSHGADAQVIAHYTAGARNLWANLHGGGDDYSITVADEADLAGQLNRDCHVAVYGILFDFNKSTIRPDSDPVLQGVLSMLTAHPELKLEIQGHTDNIGSDEYNQKLSESRAVSVVGWLTNKGIDSARLTAKGYGMKQPVADNGSDEGRARNRRVELKKEGCAPQ